MGRVSLMITTMLVALVLGSGVALAATIVGTNGDDTRNGTANRDVMYGLGGDDILRGRGGNDEIDGGANGDMYLSGGAGNDEVSGGSGADGLFGGDGFDLLYGGNGADGIYADDDVLDYIDCGIYRSPGTTVLDNDTVYADRIADGDLFDDILYDCETIN
ncbi:MAG: hypothetical protein H0V83_09575 [Rubrobacter sp.]|nr:hypothetical protein [Rubrobacter sp.]